MFKKFKELFSSENLLDTAFDTTIKMLEFDQKMYQASRDSLRDSSTNELPFDVRQMDRKINKYEREVRRNVLTHLTIAGIANLVPGMVLVSIVVDVERIGDYTKNIVDLAKLHKAKLHGGPYEPILLRLEAQVARHFDSIIPVLRKQDKSVAREIMQAEDEFGKEAEGIVSELVQTGSPQLSVGDAVSVALYARYLKRINAHMTNIASAIVNPFPRISFREKPSERD
jgi:phosphate transport system protein